MNWSSLPDIFAIAVRFCAFASTTRRNYSPSARLWLIGWLMIALHFVAHLFVSFPGVLGFMADFLTTVSLVWAGVLFLSAVNPNRKELFSRWMMVILLVSNTLYTLLITTDHPSRWALTLAASLFGLGPLALYLAAPVLGKNINCRHCLATSVLNLALAVFLLLFQNRPGNGIDLALSAVLVTVYLGCSISFFFSYRRATAGAFITIAGFAVWASVFWLGPTLYYFFPKFQVESEVWNLPKYIVAVGMILLLLEDQIEHNKHLALHDPLTGLPNRRLFEDRLASALDRARRTNTQMVLLIIDLNRFKEVNDHFGHHVGDLLLQRVGAIFPVECAGQTQSPAQEETSFPSFWKNQPAA